MRSLLNKRGRCQCSACPCVHNLDPAAPQRTVAQGFKVVAVDEGVTAAMDDGERARVGSNRQDPKNVAQHAGKTGKL